MPEHKTKKPPKSRIPWVCLSVGFILDPKLKRARARAVWPWVLTVLKRFNNRAPLDELHHEIAAIDLDLPEVETGRQMTGLLRVGLLNEDEDGFYSTPNWYKYQRDNRKNRRDEVRGAVDHVDKPRAGGGSSTKKVDDPPKAAVNVDDPPKVTGSVNDPPNSVPLRQRSTQSVDRPMSTVNRLGVSTSSVPMNISQKGASPATPSPWDWRQKWTREGVIRWEVGSIETAFRKLWPAERMSRTMMAFAKELSTTPADQLDRAFSLISPDAIEAGDEWPRPYSIRKALTQIQKTNSASATPEQMDEEAEQANLGKLFAGDAASRRSRQTLAEEFLGAGERPAGQALELIRMSFSERELALPKLFA